MTPDNFRMLNSVLGLNDWAIDAECTDAELSTIALAMARETGEPLDPCIRLVAALHATARLHATLTASSQGEALATRSTSPGRPS